MPKPRLVIGNVKHRMLPIFLRRSSDTSQHPTLSTLPKTQHISQLPPDASAKDTSICENQKTFAETRENPHSKPSQTPPSTSTAVPAAIIPEFNENKQQIASLSTPSDDRVLCQEHYSKPLITLDRATPKDEDGPVVRALMRPNEPHTELTSTLEPGPVFEPAAIATEELSVSPIELSTPSQGFARSTEIMPAQTILHKRVWVKRQGASATLVQIGEDDLVDDVKEKILRKYGNSLGKTFDAPDVTLRIIPRADSHGHHERSLGPEELVSATLNQYYPAGQTVDEALIIDIPHRRTPRHSPRVYMDHHRPSENGSDYFSIMPVAINHSPHLTSNPSIPTLTQPPVHAISVLNTGQLPNVPLPSPGAISRRHGSHRPKYGRTTTSSPTVLTTNAAYTNAAYTNAHAHTDRIPGTPGIATLPTPPIPTISAPSKAVTPPARVASPKPAKSAKPKKPRKPTGVSNQSTSLLDGGVPPISVLIVEDNIINLKLLEAFMKRLKVRWQTAMNGRDAVNKWRTGGFHLVLMDIQLPIMSGLEATREIRRLESVNGIGVLSAKVGDALGSNGNSEKAEGNDQLQNIDQFKSPVIVVALTASSLQSDRHEALAAGCNDFLTKPVNFVWLERKVMEWGCMQALIDFDGWRKWKEFAQSAPPAVKTSKPSTTIGTGSGAGAGATGSTKPSGGSALAAVQKSNRRINDTNSDSTDTTDIPPTKSSKSVSNTLVALRNKTESDDTIGSIDSVASNDSVDTIELSSPQRAPLVPSLSTMSSSSSNSTVTSATHARSSLSRQTSSQSTRTNSNRDGYPISPNRMAVNSSPLSPSSATFEDGRRRKRSSFGRGGLNGVAEELEGLGAS